MYIFSTGEYVETGKSLGEGACGSVKELTRIRDQKKFALKIQNKMSEQEIDILKKIKENPNKNVVQIEDFKFERDYYFIVMEFCDTSLYNQIQQRLVDQRDLRYLMVSIADGLKHLHNLNIIHRDLKPENILIKAVNDGRHTQNIYKICDFGLSKQIDVTQTQKIGTCYYMAPELILGLPYNNKIDIWSFGTIIYELITGDPLFNGISQNQIMEEIISYQNNNKVINEKLNKLDDEYRQLVLRMLTPDPQKRITLNEVFNELRVRHRSLSVKKQKDPVQQVSNQNYFRAHSPFQPQTQIFQQINLIDQVNQKQQINNTKLPQQNYMINQLNAQKMIQFP